MEQPAGDLEAGRREKGDWLKIGAESLSLYKLWMFVDMLYYFFYPFQWLF